MIFMCHLQFDARISAAPMVCNISNLVPDFGVPYDVTVSYRQVQEAVTYAAPTTGSTARRRALPPRNSYVMLTRFVLATFSVLLFARSVEAETILHCRLFDRDFRSAE
jgi:hypothetical protein